MGKVARSALWLLAQFADTEARAEAALAAVAACVPTIGGEQEVRLLTEVHFYKIPH